MSTENYLQSLFGLSGKTAVVIGGTGVLGGSIAEALAHAGAHAVIVGNSEERGNAAVERIEAAGGSAQFQQANATRRDDLERVRDALKSQGRGIEILVNGAGINSATPFLEIPDDEWDRIMSVNLKAVKIACQVFGQVMLEAGTGSIINIASLSAITPLSRVFTYSASKAAVLNLTLNLGREWAEQGVRVNALSPGFFPAEQNKKVLTPDRVEQIMNHTPMNRFGSPEELAGAVLLLAGNAGSFIAGENIVVDGGFSGMTI